MFGDPASHRHLKTIPLRDEFQDLRACQLKLLLEPVAPGNPWDDRVDSRGLGGAEAERRIETEATGPTFETDVLEETLGQEGDQRLEALDRATRSTPARARLAFPHVPARLSSFLGVALPELDGDPHGQRVIPKRIKADEHVSFKVQRLARDAAARVQVRDGESAPYPPSRQPVPGRGRGRFEQ